MIWWSQMVDIHKGRCLCGAIRYETLAEPLRVTICHCRFCQRLTGSSFLLEPIFRKQDVLFEGVAAKTYEHRSATSGMRVTLNFCGRCSTTLCLALERFPGVLGICGGTFDDPDWFERAPGKYRHIFIRSAQSDVVLPANVDLFERHAIELNGTPNLRIVLAHALSAAEARGKLA